MIKNVQTTIDFSDYIKDRTRDFSGRGWVFSRINDWLQKNERFFLLTGRPGSGKTSLAARLVQMSLGEIPSDNFPTLGRDSLTFFHFCQAQNDPTLIPQRFIEALSRQLANKYQPFAQALLQTGDQNITINSTITAGSAESIAGVIIQDLHIANVSTRVAFDRVVRKPLEQLYSEYPNETIVILVDSLDEALTINNDENIMTLISNIIDDPADLPANVRFILTSRPDPRVLRSIGKASLDLIDDSPDGIDDVQEYAYRRLQTLSDPKREELANLVSSAGSGNFLYARYVLDDLLVNVEKIDDLSQLKLPKGLDGIYSSFLKRELACNLERWEDRYRPLLGILAVAFGEGLTKEQIIGVTGLLPSKTDDILRACAQYIVGSEPNGPFRIYHQSFRDFLLKEGDYYVYPTECHWKIVAHYRGKAPTWNDVEWSQVDNYGIAHLVAHLSLAGRDEQLQSLLGRCWAQVKEQREGSLAGFLHDVKIAWKSAETQNNLGQQIRYSLFEASVRALAGNLPLPLLAALVEHKVWTPEQVLRYAQEITEEAQKAEVLVTLCPLLPPDLFEEILQLSRTISIPSNRVKLLATLSAYAPEGRRNDIINEALAALQKLEYASDQASNLAAIAGHLPEGVLASALEIALSIQFDGDKAVALSGLVPHLSPALLPKARDAAWSLTPNDLDIVNVVRMLLILASRLPPDEQHETWRRALDVASKIKDEGHAGEALALLAPALPDDMMPQMLEAAKIMHHPYSQARAVAALLPRCSARERGLMLQTGLEAVHQMGGGKDPVQVRWLAAFLPHLSEEEAGPVFTEALTEAQGNEWHSARVQGLALLIPPAPETMRDALRAEALKAVREHDNSFRRSEAIVDLAPQLLMDQRAELLDLVQTLDDEDDQVRALVGIAKYISPDLLKKALTMASTMIGDEQRHTLLAGLAPQLPRDLLLNALAIARSIRDRDEQASVLLALSLELSPDQCPLSPEKILAAVNAISFPPERIRALHRLILWLPEPLRAGGWNYLLNALRACPSPDLPRVLSLLSDMPDAILEKVLDMIDGLFNVSDREQALLALASRLPESRLKTRIESVFEMPVAESRAEAWTVLLPRISVADQHNVLSRELAKKMEERESSRAYYIAIMAPCLPASLMNDALALAEKLQNPHYCAEALAGLVPHLPEDNRKVVLKIAIKAATDSENLEALAKIAPWMKDELMDMALDAVRRIDDHSRRARAFASLLPYLDKSGQAKVAEEGLAACQGMYLPDYPVKYLPQDRIETLLGLAPYMSFNPDWKKMFWAAYYGLYSHDRARALLALLPFMPTEKRPNYLAEAVVMGSLWVWSHDPARGARERAVAWTDLIEQWQRLSPSDAQIVWQRGLRALASRPRPDLLLDIAFLAPLLNHNGATDDVVDSIQALMEASSIWP